MKKYLFFIALIFIYNCTEHKSSSSSRYQDTEYEESEDYDEDEDSIEEEEGYPDGTYDATIRVYNPNTGHNATYTLEVEVENEELTKIYWNNGGGGWMTAISPLLILVMVQPLSRMIEGTNIEWNWISLSTKNIIFLLPLAFSLSYHLTKLLSECLSMIGTKGDRLGMEVI